MTTNDPNRGQNTFEATLLIQLLQNINAGIETLKGLEQSSNSTMALLLENMIGLRAEVKEWERETLETRAWRNDLELEALQERDAEYAKEMEKVRREQKAVQKALDAIKAGRGQTAEKMKAIATDVIIGDKVDLRGVKISSRQFTILIISAVVLLALLIFMLPDTVSQILIRLAGLIGGQPTPP